MGYRSTFVTSDSCVELPTWFQEKYKNTVHFGCNCTLDKDEIAFPSFPIASRGEGKCYGMWSELVDDIQIVLINSGKQNTVILTFLHEDGAMTKWTIDSNNMVMKDYNI